MIFINFFQLPSKEQFQITIVIQFRKSIIFLIAFLFKYLSMIGLSQLVHSHFRVTPWTTIYQVHKTNNNLINRNYIQHLLRLYFGVYRSILILCDTMCHHHHVAINGLIVVILHLYWWITRQHVIFIHVGSHTLYHLIPLNKRPHMRLACLH